MTKSHKILNISPLNLNLEGTLSKELGVSRILARVLINRGIRNAQEGDKFLNAGLNELFSPFLFSEMQKAAGIIKKAAASKEKVMVFGDYDVDGVTALAVMKLALAKLGLKPVHYLPHRIKEGYGLNKNIAHIAHAKGVKLLITVDCGTNSQDEIKELRHQGIEVVVTDHHEPLNSDTPFASAIINPKLKSGHYPYRDLAGVGVAFKLAQAVTAEDLFENLDLVSLGTIADVVPLTGENRIMVRERLSRIRHTKNMGLNALIENSGIKDKDITTGFVSYILGPRLNASGRMDTAEVSLKLLLSQNEEEAKECAQAIETFNRQRQKVEGKILQEAEDLINREINFKEHKVIVVAKDNWHQGVLGIVASKLADRFYRPTILISITEDLCKGSGRSIKNFHLFQALSECQDFLETFGGHSHAAGIVIAKDNIGDFRNKINLLAQERLHLEDLLPRLDIDMELKLSELDAQSVLELEVLEPFGTGNPEPLFYTQGLKLKGSPQVLGRDTLKFWVSEGQATCQAIGFGMGGLKESLMHAHNFSLVYSPKIDRWQGDEAVILEIEDIFFG